MPPAADEVLIIKSVTHRDFNEMIKVKMHVSEGHRYLFFISIDGLFEQKEKKVVMLLVIMAFLRKGRPEIFHQANL